MKKRDWIWIVIAIAILAIVVLAYTNFQEQKYLAPAPEKAVIGLSCKKLCGFCEESIDCCEGLKCSGEQCKIEAGEECDPTPDNPQCDPDDEPECAAGLECCDPPGGPQKYVCSIPEIC